MLFRSAQMLRKKNITTSAVTAKRAFTLVEILIVISILSILVALVVSVSKYVFNNARRDNTYSAQKIIMEAVHVFYEENQEYPMDENNPGNTGPKQTFRQQLEDVVACRQLLEKLNTDVLAESGQFLDAWGNPMQYEEDEGMGDRPVITSAGPDEKIEDDPSTNDDDETEDNLRSDLN